MINRQVFLWLGVAAALAASFLVGTRVGIDQHLKMDSSLKAAILVLELRALREGKGQSLIERKEIELDGNILSAIGFQDSGAPWVFWPHAHDVDHRPSLSIAAQYRKQFPPVVPAIAPLADAPDPGELRPYAHDVEKATTTLIRRYGK